MFGCGQNRATFSSDRLMVVAPIGGLLNLPTRVEPIRLFEETWPPVVLWPVGSPFFFFRRDRKPVECIKASIFVGSRLAIKLLLIRQPIIQPIYLLLSARWLIPIRPKTEMFSINFARFVQDKQKNLTYRLDQMRSSDDLVVMARPFLTW